MLFRLLVLMFLSAHSAQIPLPCDQDPSKQKIRSEELQKIVAADQEDRKDFAKMGQEQLANMAKRDLERRKRVGEIFGEGCLTSAKDYAAAALVFQHGDRPDHFYQAYLWSKRSVELGDNTQRHLVADGIDRYLLNTAHKQLFASQATQEPVGACYCLQSVETSFPDRMRIQYTRRTMKDALAWVDQMNQGKKCPRATQCPETLTTPPKGLFPGIW